MAQNTELDTVAKPPAKRRATKPAPERRVVVVELTPEELKAVAANKAHVTAGLETPDINASQRAHDKLQQAARDRLK